MVDRSIQPTLDRISRSLREVQRLFADGGDLDQARQRLTVALRNLSRIAPSIGEERYGSIQQPILSLLEKCPASSGNEADQGDAAPQQDRNQLRWERTGLRGRPRISINLDDIKLLLEKGYTCKKIAKHYQCSMSSIYKLLYANNINVRRHRYSSISETELKRKIEAIHQDSPNTGNEMMCGYLRSQGVVVQRNRVRATLSSIDPQSVATRWSQTVARRVYAVPGPNSLWHMDGHMKLIRWGFTIHGCIDGFSRVITFLQCGMSNNANYPLKLFAKATLKYGIPSRVRSDYGGENTQVALLMNLVRGHRRGSHITGSSVHNQRIERLWKDLFKEVVGPFYSTFYAMEDRGLLQPDDNIQLWSLQFVYQRIINIRLHSFQNAWNCHRIRTENNRTPEQIWLDGIHKSRQSERPEIQEIFDDDSSLRTLMKDSLEQMGLSLPDEVDGRHDFDIPRGDLLSDDQVNEVANFMNAFVEAEEKYVACVQKVTEILNNS